jgi:hypothetical protein
LKIISQKGWRNKNLITFALPFCKGKIGKSEKFFDKIAIAARKRS